VIVDEARGDAVSTEQSPQPPLPSTDPPNADELSLEELGCRVLLAMTRRYGQYEMCQDAVQEALLAASVQWPDEGRPQNPHAWVRTVASRRLVDAARADSARRRREAASAAEDTRRAGVQEPPAGATPADADDTLELLFLCCTPPLSPASRVALALRAVGGLSTAEVAAAFLVPEATMARRISRAKAMLAATVAGRPAAFPELQPGDRGRRLGAVLHVLYLIFTEGYAASSGDRVHRPDLAREAIRLATAVQRAAPQDGETAGLLALMLLTDARRAARTDDHDELVPLADQNRLLWDAVQTAEAVSLLERALPQAAVGPYQVQAAIAAVHMEAATAAATDWPQIAALYGLLDRLAPSPVVTLNRAVAVAEVDSPAAALRLLAPLSAEHAAWHRLTAVQGHLLEALGDIDGARTAFEAAARQTTSLPERRHLLRRAARLSSLDGQDIG